MPGLLTVALALVSCDSWNQSCNNAFNEVCLHLVECDQYGDFASCDQELREDYYCDQAAPIEELRTCADLAKTNESCVDIMPEQCFTVLCNETLGCIEGQGITCESGATDPLCAGSGEF